MNSDPSGYLSVGTLIDIILLAGSFSPWGIWFKATLLGLYVIRLGIAVNDFIHYKSLYNHHKISGIEWAYQKVVFAFTLGSIVLGAISTLVGMRSAVLAASTGRAVLYALGAVYGTATSGALLLMDFCDFIRTGKKPPRTHYR